MNFTKIILPVILSSLSFASLALSATENADVAMGIFLDSCAKNYGNNAGSSKWAASRMTRANPDFSSKILRGETGEV